MVQMGPLRSPILGGFSVLFQGVLTVPMNVIWSSLVAQRPRLTHSAAVEHLQDNFSYPRYPAIARLCGGIKPLHQSLEIAISIDGELRSRQSLVPSACLKLPSFVCATGAGARLRLSLRPCTCLLAQAPSHPLHIVIRNVVMRLPALQLKPYATRHI